jgi:hypothetical protein
LNEDQEVELEAMMRQRKLIDSRLNRALGELLGSGKGAREVILAAEEAESLLRSIAGFASRLE